MNKDEINQNNILIANFLGYTYFYKLHDDYSDIGGLYTDFDVYSKTPLEFKFKHEEENTYEGIIFELNKEQDYILIKTGGWEIDFDAEFKYDYSWDALIPVCIEFCNKILNIKHSENDIFISHKNSIRESISTMDINFVYENIIDGIKFYNKNK